MSSDGGATWTVLWIQPDDNSCVNDDFWQQMQFDVTAYKSATFRGRWCFAVEVNGVLPSAGWSVDDVALTSAPCP